MSPPQLTVVVGRPTPRKLKVASSTMYEPRDVVPMTMIGANELGMICLMRLRHGVEPKAMDAVLNSRFFASMTAPRAMRAVDTQPKSVMTSTSFQMEVLVLNICSTTMAPSRIGSARKISVRRLSTASTQPPKKPASAPMNAPRTTTRIVDSRPTLSEVRVP